MEAISEDELKVDKDIATSLQELDIDELESFAELHETMTEDAEIELFIFACFHLLKRTGSRDWAAKAVSKAQNWIVSTPIGDVEYRRRYQIYNLINHTASGYGHQITGDESLGMKIAENLFNGIRYRITGSMQDLNDTINYRWNLLASMPPSNPKKPEAIVSLADWLIFRFKQDKEFHLGDLQTAISIVKPLTDVELIDPHSRAHLLVRVGEWLEMLYNHDEHPQSQDRVIETCSRALCLPFECDKLHCTICALLGRMLALRALRTENTVELDEAKATLETAMESPYLDQYARVSVLNSLAITSSYKFKHSGDYQDLGHAIDHIEMALMCDSIGDSASLALVLNLVGTLRTLIKDPSDAGRVNKIDRAIAVLDLGLKKLSENDISLHRTLVEPASSLTSHFNATKNIEHLDRACRVMGLAVKAAPTGLERAQCLCKLSEYNVMHFRHTGRRESLDQAVSHAERAASTTPLEDPERGLFLAILGIHILTRFERSKSREDLYFAGKTLSESLRLLPSTDPFWSKAMQTFASVSFCLYQRTRDAQYLTTAIDALEKLLIWCSTDDRDYEPLACNLALWLCNRARGNHGIEEGVLLQNQWNACIDKTEPLIWRYTGSVADIDRALELMNTVIESSGSRDSDWVAIHKWLGDIYMHRFQMALTRPEIGRDAISELDHAIHSQKMALDSMPREHPLAVALWGKLGAALSKRFDISQNPDDDQRSLKCMMESLNLSGRDPRTCIQLARGVGARFIGESKYEEAAQVLKDAVDLLPAACPRSLNGEDKQAFLKQPYGLASMAAAAALSAGQSASDALRLLEAGRGVVAGLLLDTRTGLSKLQRTHPELASKFESIGEQLNMDPDVGKESLGAAFMSDQPEKSQINQRIDLQQEFNEVVQEIRQQRGLSGFLLPLSDDEIMAAADSGPIVVVNISVPQSYAILIERHQIRSIPLSDLLYARAEDIAKALANPNAFQSHSPSFLVPLLEWMWVAIARPVLNSLGIISPPQDDKWPHIWWIPTGAVTHLPIHAAGIHRKGSHDTVMDRAISSYTSSIRSLIHSREQIAQSTLSVADPQHALLISMADTPSQTSLPFATEEVAVIKPLVASIGLAPVDGGGHTVEVLKHMRSSRIMHFAGHGLSHPLDPTKSSLLTKDWETNPLTVEKLRQQSLQEHSPFLAYLSSCSTGAIKDHSLADEAIHLISACQLAGFRHAIGALWEVSDQHCVDVARIVYETLKEDGLTDQAVARGLHRATRHVRDSSQSMTTRSASITDAAEDAFEDQSTEEKLRDLEREFEAFEIHDRERSVEDRDAVPVGSRRRRQEPLGSFFWVPYVHYGA